MIKPTIGRVVWYYPHGSNEQPFAAIIAYPKSDGLVNIAYFNHYGHADSAQSVPLIQDGEPVPTGPHCQWMPYQKGQAAKTETLEKALQNNHELLDHLAKSMLA